GKLEFPAESARASGPDIAKFIMRQLRSTPPELTRWTAVLMSSATARLREDLGIPPVGLIKRAPQQINDSAPGAAPVFDVNEAAQTYWLNKSNIQSPGDEGIDFIGRPFTTEWLATILPKVT